MGSVGRPPYSAISSASRVAILRMLQEEPHRTVGELCTATGLHPNTVREHLQRLIDAGYAVAAAEHRTTRGRPRVLYSAATGDEESSPIARQKVRDAARRGDLMRRIMPETDDGDLPVDAVHQLDALVDDLATAGFDPVVDPESLTLDLTPCHHAAAQTGGRDVLCEVHLGVMQGVLTEAGGPLAVGGMLPGCDPTVCIIQLRSAR